MDYRPAVREFLQHLLDQKGDERPLRDGDSLFLSGRLQSLDAVDVVMFLEEQWHIDFGMIGFDQTQLDTVELIDALIQRTSASR
jgi:acyl carrier protein